jgi:hypothetical protein
MPLLSLTQNTTVLSLLAKRAITSTDTKAEQLDGIVIRHAAHTALAMTTNDYCTIEQTVATIPYTRSKPMDHFYYFFT